MKLLPSFLLNALNIQGAEVPWLGNAQALFLKGPQSGGIYNNSMADTVAILNSQC